MDFKDNCGKIDYPKNVMFISSLSLNLQLSSIKQCIACYFILNTKELPPWMIQEMRNDLNNNNIIIIIILIIQQGVVMYQKVMVKVIVTKIVISKLHQ